MTFYNLLENVIKKIKNRLHICRFVLKLLRIIVIPNKNIFPRFCKKFGVYFLRENWKRFQNSEKYLFFYLNLETFPKNGLNF